MTKIKLVISDFHLSRGKWLKDGRRNPLEDFHQDQKFKEFLEHYSSGFYENAEVELIVNGDFFDPLAIVPVLDSIIQDVKKLEFPIEVEEEPAIQKFEAIVAGHPIVFDAFRNFLNRGKRIVFRWGNHDAAILWPRVQTYLRQVLPCKDPGQIEFQVKPYVFDRICVDHGHQHEIVHQFDEQKIFIERTTKDGPRVIQNLPFGSFFVLAFLNRLKLQKRYINQVYPFNTYLKVSLFLEPFTAVMNSLKVAWFFIKMRFITHPMRFVRIRKTIMMIGEIFHRPALEDIAENMLTGSGSEALAFDTLIMGHNHQAALRIFPGGKQYINTGTWTPITSLDMSTLGHKILRTYALIEYVDGKPRSSLKVWNGNPHITEDFT